MAKKIKNQKLLTNKNASGKILPPQHIKISKSAFSAYSDKLQQAKQKKIEKLKDTRNRVLNKKKQNKVSRQPGFGGKFNKNTKINKFALIDDPMPQGLNTNKLTHKGTKLQELKNFNDVHFGQDNFDEDSAEFDNMHAQINFHGFDQTQKDEKNEGRPKSKNQIYKEIIQKSKAHKRQRQKEYEQNFQAAVELDQQFPQFVSKLKFRTGDKKTRQKIQKKDRQYQKLINQLREDQKVVANKVVDNNKKGQQKVRKKKIEQLKQLLEGSDSEEEDVRGWVKGINNPDEDGSELSDQNDEQQNSEIRQQSQIQNGSYQDSDEIDQVQLSSGDDDEDDEQLQYQDQKKKGSGGNRKIVIQNEQSSELLDQGQESAIEESSKQLDEDIEVVVKKRKKINKDNKKKTIIQGRQKAKQIGVNKKYKQNRRA